MNIMTATVPKRREKLPSQWASTYTRLGLRPINVAVPLSSVCERSFPLLCHCLFFLTRLFLAFDPR